MSTQSVDVPVPVHDAFKSFTTDTSLFALPLQFSAGELRALPAISFSKDQESTFQHALSKLDTIVNTKTVLYLIVRRNGSLTAITYVPYLANDDLKTLHLANRQKLIQALGEDHFALSVICKEPGEVIDARSWDERDAEGESLGKTHDHEHEPDDQACNIEETGQRSFKDLGFKKNKCRLCDRRMKYPIEDSAVEALKRFKEGGDCVQISVDIATETLVLNFQASHVSPSELPSKLSSTDPSLTFYRHPESNLLYFIFYSPDSAPIKVRMMHTMAIPGLVNITAKELGVDVDQKIEIHDPEDLVFEGNDDRIGKFRSMYLLNESKGTESTWKGMPVS